MRVRMGVGTIGGVSAAAFTLPCLTSSNVAFGEDIERPFGFLGGAGAGDGEGEGFGRDGKEVASGGCVWLRVGVLRPLLCSFSCSFGASCSLRLSVDGDNAPLAMRANRSFKLGFAACVGVVGGGDASFSFSRQFIRLFLSSTGESFTGTGGRSIGVRMGGDVAIVDMSMSGFGGRRVCARAADDGADDAALPGRRGPTRVARGASSDEEEELLELEDEEEERTWMERGFCGAGLTVEVRGEEPVPISTRVTLSAMSGTELTAQSTYQIVDSMFEAVAVAARTAGQPTRTVVEP